MTVQHKDVDPAVIVAYWDGGEIVAEFTDAETIAAIAKALKVDAESVRQALIEAGRIEADR